ncbi:hypothetical protein BKA93DRAFT_728402, partial [Sparassis latifolia]
VADPFAQKIKDDPGSEEQQGKNLVDAALAAGVACFVGLPATFLYTGNFYENMVYRAHMRYDPEADVVDACADGCGSRDADVEKDLAGVTKAVLDQYEARPELHHEYLYVSNARVSPKEIVAAVTKVTGKRAAYVTLATMGVPDRDIMFRLYNEMGMYGGKEIPDENVLALGVELHSVEDFIRERLAPHLGLPVVG